PPGRTRGQPAGRPPLQSNGERVLDGFLGDVDVTEVADKDGHRATVLLAIHAFDLRNSCGRHARYQFRALPSTVSISMWRHHHPARAGLQSGQGWSTNQGE